MQNFKVGDWVRDLRDNRVFQINSTNFNLKLSIKNTVYAHWQPKLGEWCWFLNNNREPVLKQFLQMCPIVPTNYISKQGTISGSVEPFIGQLPSFLKDNT